MTTIFEDFGNTEYLVFSLDPDNYPEEDTIYCKIVTPIELALGTLEYGDLSLVFEEKVR